jgi:hypothetical protein
MSNIILLGAFFKISHLIWEIESSSYFKNMQRQLIFLLFFTALIAGTDNKAKAQGWSFTMTINYSGPCGATLPQLPIFTIPFMPTHGDCESIRAQLIAIRGSVPVIDNNGNYIGDCTAYVSCSACTGSDMAGGSSLDPGNVSINGPAQGSAFFAPHQSISVENWIEETQQKLRAMGYVVNANNTIKAQDVSLTGNEDFDKYYAGQIVRYEKPEQGGTVYLKEGTKGIIDPNDLKDTGKKSETENNVTSSQKEGTSLGSVVPPPGSIPEYANTYNFSTVSSANEGIVDNSPSGKSFTDAAIDFVIDKTKSKYSEWVGYLAGEVCSNMTEAANILGNPDVNSLSDQDMARFDEKSVLLRANVDMVKSEVNGYVSEGIATITGKAVKAVEYIGEKVCIKVSPSMSPEVVKKDYNTGLAAGKYIIGKSATVKKVWGYFN